MPLWRLLLLGTAGFCFVRAVYRIVMAPLLFVVLDIVLGVVLVLIVVLVEVTTREKR